MKKTLAMLLCATMLTTSAVVPAVLASDAEAEAVPQIATLSDDVATHDFKSETTINGVALSEFTAYRPSSGFETTFRKEVNYTYSDGVGWAIESWWNGGGGEAIPANYPMSIRDYTGVQFDYYTALDDDKLTDKAIVLTFDNELKPNDYRITIKDSVVTIEGGIGTGLWYGVGEFLETFLGFRFISADVIYYPEEPKTLTNDVFEGHDSIFELRNINSFYASTSDNQPDVYNNLMRRLNSCAGGNFIMANARFGRNMGTIAGYNAHSFEYQIGRYNTDFKKSLKGDNGQTQPCLSDPEYLKAVVYGALKEMEYRLNTKRYGVLTDEEIIERFAPVITVAWNDNTNYCDCKDCKAASSGDSNLSDLYISFVNRAAREIKKVYPTLKIMALAYDDTRTPPKHEVVDDNVIIMFCSGACNIHGIAHAEECTEIGCGTPREVYYQSVRDKDNLEGWMNVSNGNMYYWGYWDSFSNNNAQTPIWSYMKDDIKYLAEVGVKGIYAEGSSGKERQYCFEVMRDYLVSKLMWNPFMSDEEYEDLTKEFMDIYYGKAAGQYMYQYMLLWDKSGNKKNCAVNNFSGVKAIFDLDYYAENYETMEALFAAALENTTNQTYVTRIKKVRASMEFLALSGLYYQEYVNGTAEQRTAYKAKYMALYQDYKDLGMDYVGLGAELSFIEGVNHQYHSQSTIPHTGKDEENAGKYVDLSYCPLAWYGNRDGFHDVDPYYYTARFHTGTTEIIPDQTITNFWVYAVKDPVREGYKFGGWYTDEACTKAYTLGYSSSVNVIVGKYDCDSNGVFHLYAKWTKV